MTNSTAVELFQINIAKNGGIICEIDFQKRKKREGCRRSGAAGGMQNYTAWEHYEALSSLKNHVKHRMQDVVKLFTAVVCNLFYLTTHFAIRHNQTTPFQNYELLNTCNAVAHA